MTARRSPLGWASHDSAILSYTLGSAKILRDPHYNSAGDPQSVAWRLVVPLLAVQGAETAQSRLLKRGLQPASQPRASSTMPAWHVEAATIHILESYSRNKAMAEEESGKARLTSVWYCPAAQVYSWAAMATESRACSHRR